jgi:hypothetical protein
VFFFLALRPVQPACAADSTNACDLAACKRMDGLKARESGEGNQEEGRQETHTEGSLVHHADMLPR